MTLHGNLLAIDLLLKLKPVPCVLDIASHKAVRAVRFAVREANAREGPPPQQSSLFIAYPIPFATPCADHETAVIRDPHAAIGAKAEVGTWTRGAVNKPQSGLQRISETMLYSAVNLFSSSCQKSTKNGRCTSCLLKRVVVLPLQSKSTVTIGVPSRQ